MPKKLIDLTGKKFLKLTVVKRVYPNKKTQSTHWECLCDCGNTKIATGSDLRRLGINSCGCTIRPGGKLKHGKHGTFEYNVWQNMKLRCDNKNHPQYKDYGGRGIGIASEWREFSSFLKDMGLAPSGKYSIDRIDNDRGYSKENCRWADWKTQQSNKRNNRNLIYQGEKYILEDLARKFNINSTVLGHRLDMGKDLESALSGPTIVGYVDYKQRRKHAAR